MTKLIIDDKLKEIVANLFKININDVNINSSSNTVPEWDSLEQLELILAIEDIYLIKFDTKMIPNLLSINDIQLEINKLKN